MEYKERVDQIVESSNQRTERMFPILNKIDRIWNHNSDLQFCELVKLIVSDSYTDLEFTKKLDEYIDNNGIK